MSQEAAADRKAVTLGPFLKGGAISGSRAESEASAAWSRGLKVMCDPKRSIADKLSKQDGVNCVQKSATMHAATMGHMS